MTNIHESDYIKRLNDYAEMHSSPEDDLLKKLVRATHLSMLHPRMLSGPIQGKFLQMVVSMLAPKNILEIGTFTGYSALSMAQAMPSDAYLHTIEVNDEVLEFAQSFFNQSNYKDRIIAYQGSALALVEKMHTMFDLVFIDGDKREYSAYYHAVFDKIRPGGYILADNVLWDGKVLDAVHHNDKHTQEILAFNQMVTNDPRVENVLIPLRDGLMLIRIK